MLVYYIGCAALGAVAGFLVGGSSSPVVAVVLPLLFALLGGAAGVLGLMPSHPNSERSKLRFQIVGGAALAVSVPFFFGVLYGSLLRTGQDIESLVPNFTAKVGAETLSERDLARLNPQETVRAISLDNTLRKNGISALRIVRIIRQLVQAKARSNSEYEASRPTLIKIANRFVDRGPPSKGRQNTYRAAYIFVAVVAGKQGGPDASELKALKRLRTEVFKDVFSTTEQPDINDKLALAAALTSLPDSEFISDALKAEISSNTKDTANDTANDNAGKIPLGFDQFIMGIPDLRQGT